MENIILYLRWKLFNLRWKILHLWWKILYLWWKMLCLGWKMLYMNWKMFNLKWKIFNLRWKILHLKWKIIALSHSENTSTSWIARHCHTPRMHSLYKALGKAWAARAWAVFPLSRPPPEIHPGWARPGHLEPSGWHLPFRGRLLAPVLHPRSYSACVYFGRIMYVLCRGVCDSAINGTSSTPFVMDLLKWCNARNLFWMGC